MGSLKPNFLLDRSENSSLSFNPPTLLLHLFTSNSSNPSPNLWNTSKFPHNINKPITRLGRDLIWSFKN